MGSTTRLGFIAAVCFLPTALQAQQAAVTVFDGKLSHILIDRYPSLCTGQSEPAAELIPGASAITVKFTQECKGSSVKIEFTLNLAVTTPPAKQVASGEVEFDAGVRGAFSANVAFAHPKAYSSVIKFGMPARDLDPSSGFPVSAGTCTEPIFTGPARGGEWTDSLSVPECERNKRQYISKEADGSYYFRTWTEMHAYLWSDKDTTAESIATGMEATIFYKLTPNLEKVRITSATPSAGARQDPNGKFNSPKGINVTAAYDLVGADRAEIALIAIDRKNEAVLATSDAKTITKGSGTAELSLPNFDIPRNTEEIEVGVVMAKEDTTDVIAESEPFRYPVYIELSVPHVEAIQVVQDERNSIRLVANRPTVLLVPLLAQAVHDDGGFGIAVQVRATKGGRRQAGAAFPEIDQYWQADVTVQRDRDSGNPIILLPMEWVATPGTLELEIEVNPAGPAHLTEHDTSDNIAHASLLFEDRPAINVRYLSVCVESTDGTVDCPAASHGGEDILFTVGLFPVDISKVRYEPLPLPAIIWKLPLQTVPDWDRLLVPMQGFVDLANAVGAGIEQLVLWLPPKARASLGQGQPGLRGLSMNIANNGTGRVIMLPAQDPPEAEFLPSYALAHELGHDFGLEHGFPPPPCSDTNPASVSGEINISAVSPFVLFPKDEFHFMTSCMENSGGFIQMPAIRPDQYRKLWESGFQPAASAPAPVATADAAAAAPLGAPRVPGAADALECALVQGVVRRNNTAQIDRITRIPCTANPPKPAFGGNLCLRFTDNAGTTLDETCFSVSFAVPDSNLTLDERAFYLNTSFPTGTSRIALLQNGVELAAQSASRSAPSISFLTPVSGDQWSGAGPLEISWNATDEDGDALRYVLEYSSNGGSSWLPLEADGLQQTRYSLDATQILGGRQVHFRVTASDGFRQTAATVGPVEIVQTPVADVTPSAGALDFLNVLIAKPAKLKFGIRNTGTGPLNIASITSKAATPFSVVEAGPVRIAAQSTRWFTVQFLPVAKGPADGAIQLVTDDTTHAAIEIPLAGEGVDAYKPAIEAIPKSIAFGNVVAGKSKDFTVRLRNRGPADLTIASIVSSSALFAVAKSESAVTLKAGESYEAKVTFSPTEVGSFTARLTVVSDDPKNGSLEIAATGSAVATENPVMRVQPATLNFGSVAVGERKDLSLVVANAGGSPLILSRLILSSPLYSIASAAPPITVAAGFQVEITVRFQPDSPGAKQASLTISGNDPSAASVEVPITGTGAAQAPTPRIEVSPSALVFGDVTTGQSRTLTLTIRNTGSVSLSITAAASNNPRFTLLNAPSLPLQIAAGNSRDIAVQFAAASAAAESGVLTVSSNDPQRPTLTVALSGTGVAPTANPHISVAPASLDFGAITIGQTADLSLTVRNSGSNGSLEVTSAGIDAAAFRLVPDFTPFTLAAGATRILTVRFSPQAAGEQPAILTLASNDRDAPSLAIALRGTGQPTIPTGNVTISVTPASLAFGSLLTGQERTLTFAITGTGTTPLIVTAIEPGNSRVTVVSPSSFPVSTSLMSTIQVVVRFAPVSAGAVETNLVIRSNAANDPALTIAVTGVAYAPGNLELKVDDGSFERTMSVPGLFVSPIFVNRLTPPAYPATLRTIRVYFHDKADGVEPRTNITIVSGVSESGTSDINRTVLRRVSATAPATLGRWADYDITPITITSGDFVVGFSFLNGDTPYTVAVDAGPPYAKRSYTSTDGITYELIEAANRETNLGIRGVVTLGSPTL